MANRLSLMTAGAAGTVATIDLGASEAVERRAPEDEIETPRSWHPSAGYAQSLSHAYRLPRGTLVLRLTGANRATVHNWIDSYLTGSHLIRHTPDTVGAPLVHKSWKLYGTQPEEVWEWLTGSDYHRTRLPVVDVTDVL